MNHLPEEFISFIAAISHYPSGIAIEHICGFTRVVTPEDIEFFKEQLITDPILGYSEKIVSKFVFILLDRPDALKILQGKDLTISILEKIKEATPKYMDA